MKPSFLQANVSFVTSTAPCVLALNIAAGSVYCAVAISPDEVLFDDPLERLDMAEGLDPAEQLADFSARFRLELRRIAPIAVGVLHTKLNANWKYAGAFRRITVEAAVMLVVVETSTSSAPIAYRLIKQHAMAKTVGIPLPKLVEVGTTRWGDGVTRYRKDRLPAVVGALALAKEHCS